jgi:hypothetical protein
MFVRGFSCYRSKPPPLSRGEFTIHAWANGLLEAALALGAAGLGACPRVERGSQKVRQPGGSRADEAISAMI